VRKKKKTAPNGDLFGNDVQITRARGGGYGRMKVY
jgi:hypothetical protein